MSASSNQTVPSEVLQIICKRGRLGVCCRGRHDESVQVRRALLRPSLRKAPRSYAVVFTPSNGRGEEVEIEESTISRERARAASSINYMSGVCVVVVVAVVVVFCLLMSKWRRRWSKKRGFQESRCQAQRERSCHVHVCTFLPHHCNNTLFLQALLHTEMVMRTSIFTSSAYNVV